MSLSHGNQTLQPVYIIIENFSTKTWQSQKWVGMILLSFIPIVYEKLEYAKNKNKDLKIKINHIA